MIAMNVREIISDVFSEILTKMNFHSVSCYEKNEFPFKYSIENDICIESRERTRKQLKNCMLKNMMTVSEGISTITNRLKDVKFHLYEFDIENHNNDIVFISIEFDKKLNACFSIFNKDFEEYDDIIHIDCNLDDAELFIKKIHAAILLFYI